MPGKHRATIAPGGVGPVISCCGVVNPVAHRKPHIRAYKTELMKVAEVMKIGDNLPNTAVSLQAKVKRRALLVAVHYEGDMRNTQGDSLHIPTSPLDVWRVYRMLLTRGYEPQNIRILVEGLVGDDLSHGTKLNITASLEWLFHSAESGDYRYFHFSGHGYAYEVEEGEGKIAKTRLAPPNGIYKHPSPVADAEQPNFSPPKEQVKFYHEALLAEWDNPTFSEILDARDAGEPITLDAFNRINDEELKTMVSKLPKGCVLTITLDCMHGGQMRDVNRKKPSGSIYRGGAGQPMSDHEPVPSQPTTNPLNTYANTSPRNLFVPPAFHLHSNFSFDPKILMERVQGPEPLSGVQATVFAWSGYSTSVSQAGAFTSAFTAAVQEVEGDIQHREMFQKISRKVEETTKGKDGHSLVQLWTPCDGNDEKAEVLMDGLFKI